MGAANQLASDDFNRANADPIGGNWSTSSTGTFKINSNRAEPSALTGSDAAAYYNAITWPNDQYSEGTIKAIPVITLVGDGVGVGVRISASANTHYEVTIGSGVDNALRKIVAGASTLLAQSSTAFAIDDVVRIEAQGTTVKVSRNGSAYLQTADASIASGNAGLIYSSDSAPVSAAIDDWSGGDFSGTPVLTGLGMLAAKGT